MTVTLAATWHPHGETVRLRRLYPLLAELYQEIIIVMPPQTHAGMVIAFKQFKKVTMVMVDDWKSGRYEALRLAAERDASYIHYADLDRLIRWAQTRPDELRRTLERIQLSDCAVIGRTEKAYETHPQALIQTERTYNVMFSHIVGRQLDFSSGSKGFSLRAAQFIASNGDSQHPFGTDVEWVILARRAGFEISAMLVDGLDYETADRYSDAPADDEQQKEAAHDYDLDPDHWVRRVEIANEVIAAGLSALKRELIQPERVLK